MAGFRKYGPLVFGTMSHVAQSSGQAGGWPWAPRLKYVARRHSSLVVVLDKTRAKLSRRRVIGVTGEDRVSRLMERPRGSPTKLEARVRFRVAGGAGTDHVVDAAASGSTSSARPAIAGTKSTAISCWLSARDISVRALNAAASASSSISDNGVGFHFISKCGSGISFGGDEFCTSAIVFCTSGKETKPPQ